MNYPLNEEVIAKLQEIIDKTPQEFKNKLSPVTLFINIYNSTGTIEYLDEIYEVPGSLIKKIKHLKTLRKDMTVPKTIRSQLLALDQNAVMCWGSNSFRGTGPIDPFHNGELMFNIENVKGIKKGHISIRLMYNDLYEIEIFNDKKSVYKIDGIYNDQLIEIIGDKIGY